MEQTKKGKKDTNIELFCDTCNLKVKKYNLSKHEKTNRHILNLKKKNDDNDLSNVNVKLNTDPVIENYLTDKYHKVYNLKCYLKNNVKDDTIVNCLLNYILPLI
mgnify:CR=1 FL=1|tara:strand:+ start:439 stop:750 length:312 start_codon:yes stop_codon:yes gene_type:complete